MFKLYLIFVYISATTFGGGYAMLPTLERELVTKRNWLTKDELSDFFAIAQTTPGVIAVNTATFIGLKRKGKMGGIAATLGVITPAIVLSCLFGSLIAANSDSRYTAAALKGMGVAAMGCLTVTAAGLIRQEINMWYICLLSFIAVSLGTPSLLAALLALLIGIYAALKQKNSP